MGRQSSTTESEDATSSIIQESGFFPPWLWLTLLTIFMALVLWLCLRNITHLLPLKIQRLLQDLVDRAFGRGRIRLLDDNSYGISENRRPGIPMGLEGDSDDEDGDDELPHFPMHASSRTRGITGTLQASKDRIEEAMLSLVAGRSRRFRRLPKEEDPEAASERILVLPNISSRQTTNIYKPNLLSETNGISMPDASRSSSRPTSTLFRRDSADADAPPLPSYFNINHHQSPTRDHGRSASGSGSGDRTPPLSARSPTIRSPALSRTPSLLAIAEEASISPPAPSTAKPFSYIRRKSSSSASASSGSEQGFQDWASAVSGTSRRRDDALQESP